VLNLVLWNTNILLSTQLLIYKSMVKGITHGSETWRIKRKQRYKLLATEMNYLKRFARILRTGRFTMEDCRISRQFAEWNPQRKGSRGRPGWDWEEHAKEKLNDECFDRDLWRKENIYLGWGKLCIHRKILIYVYSKVK
jgi:hypothetical protein